jgi:hypothetical protein
MATIAVFIALGGSSYAAMKLTGKDVRDGSLSGRDIANSSLTTLDVKNRSLLAKDFKLGQLPDGPQGVPGAKGDPGTSVFAASIPSGTTVKGAWGIAGEVGTDGGSLEVGVSLPVPAPVQVEDVNTGVGTSNGGNPDASCKGTVNEPTAPPGRACVYVDPNTAGVTPTGVVPSPIDGGVDAQSDRYGFLVAVTGVAASPAPAVEAYGTWAYTAP